jgi:hypothetical protein
MIIRVAAIFECSIHTYDNSPHSEGWFQIKVRARNNLVAPVLEYALGTVFCIVNRGIPSSTSTCVLAGFVLEVLFLYLTFNS